MKDIELSALVGKKIVDINGLEKGSDKVSFFADDGNEYRFCHFQDCCESVALNDFDLSGDLNGATILSAEEIDGEAEAPEFAESYKWTFYKIETDKGGLWMRWLGESNGYYSESVDFVLVN